MRRRPRHLLGVALLVCAGIVAAAFVLPLAFTPSINELVGEEARSARRVFGGAVLFAGALSIVGVLVLRTDRDL